MGKRCGCVDTNCNCAIVAGLGVTIEGQGNDVSPYVVTPYGTAYIAKGQPGAQAITARGSGTATDPYVLQGNFTSATVATASVAEVFTKTGEWITWTLPAAKRLMRVTCIGAGQGGQGGPYWGGQGSPPAGGIGGAGGGWTQRFVYVPTTVTTARIWVGLGGNGGSGGNTGLTSGIANVTAPGQVGGTGQPSTVQFMNSDGSVYDEVMAMGGPQSFGGYPGQQPVLAPVVAPANPAYSASAGGTGQGGNPLFTDPAGGAAATPGGTHSGYDGTTVGARGGNGGAGGSATFSTSYSGGRGADGYAYGGGGGGGGSSAYQGQGARTSDVGGAGGRGADGLIVIEAL